MKIDFLRQLLFLPLLFLSTFLFGQGRFSDAHPGMEHRFYCTGRTTMHVGNGIIFNATDEEMEVTIPAGYIPAGNGHQGYVVPSETTITLAPQELDTVPITGFCADPFSPPIPAGESFPSPDDWITVDEAPDISGPEDLVSIPGFSPTTYPAGELTPTFPGTTIPLGHTVDPDSDPTAAVGLLVDIVQRILEATDSLQDAGLLSTPFSANPAVEEEAVIQQTIWLTLSRITDSSRYYTAEDFHDNLVSQYESQTGTDYDTASAQVKATMETGVSDFFEAFELTGAAAKVLIRKEEEGIKEEEKTPSPCRFSRAAADPHTWLDIKISEAWSDAAERQQIRNRTLNALQNTTKLQDQDYQYNMGRQPTSVYSFWNHNQVGAYANASAATWFVGGEETEWVWRVEKMETEAEGQHEVSMTVEGEGCETFVSGVAKLSLNATSSAFDPSAEHQDILEALDFTYSLSMKLLAALRGNPKSLLGLLKELGKNELEAQLEEWADDARLTNAQLHDRINDELEEIAREEGKEGLADLIDYAQNFDIEDASSVTGFITKAENYAEVGGELEADVGGNKASVDATSRVDYKRQSITVGGISGGKSKLDTVTISGSAPASLTVKLNGSAYSKVKAKGHGQVMADLESSSLIILVGVCIKPDETFDWETQMDHGVYGKDRFKVKELNVYLDELNDALTLRMKNMTDPTEEKVEAMLRDLVKNWKPF